jgi:hypothetical protein
VKATAAMSDKYSFEKRRAMSLKEDGFTPVQKGYLKREMRIGATNRFHLKKLMDALVSLKKAARKTEKGS